MKLYFCEREGEYWTGGLIIAAENKDEAIRFFENAENDKPFSTKELDISTKGIKYDDEFR